jgi:hypothetical protein
VAWKLNIFTTNFHFVCEWLENCESEKAKPEIIYDPYEMFRCAVNWTWGWYLWKRFKKESKILKIGKYLTENLKFLINSKVFNHYQVHKNSFQILNSSILQTSWMQCASINSNELISVPSRFNVGSNNNTLSQQCVSTASESFCACKY